MNSTNLRYDAEEENRAAEERAAEIVERRDREEYERLREKFTQEG